MAGRKDRTEQAIERLLEVAAKHEERFVSLRGEFDSLKAVVDESSTLRQDFESKHGESIVRHDERLKRLEQQRERSWSLLLGILCAVAGSIFTLVAERLFNIR